MQDSKIKKVFLSHAMEKLSRHEILNLRHEYTKIVSTYFEGMNTTIEIADSYITDLPPDEVVYSSVWYLGASLTIMSECDLVVFCTDPKESKGTGIEFECCKQYGIDYLELYPK